MAADAMTNVAEEPLETDIEHFGVAGGEPWYVSKRLWVAAAIGAALVVEFALIARARDPLAAERQAVVDLDDATKAQLAERWERFRKLTPEEQQRVRELHAAIETDAQPDELRTALVSYQQWKASLSPQQSAELVGLAPQARLDKVRKFTAEQGAIAAKTLSTEDAKTIVAWLEKQIDLIQDKLMAALPGDARDRLEPLGRRERNWALIMSALSYRGTGARFDQISQQAIVELHAQLSPAARSQFDTAVTIDEKKQLLADWIRQAVFRTMPYRDGGHMSRVSDEEIRRFFEHELKESDRARYLALPREEMNSQLRREYLRRKGLWKEPGFGGGTFGRPPFGRGPGGPGPGGPGERRPPGGQPGPQGGPPRDGPPPPRPDSRPGLTTSG